MPMLRQIAYVSRVAAGMTPAAERQLLGIAERNNRRSGITGLLATSGRHYLQVLEGSPESLQRLMPKVAVDHRHCEVRHLFDRPVQARSYACWSMGYLYGLDLGEELAALHAGSLTLEPDQLLDRFRPDDLGDSVYGRSIQLEDAGRNIPNV